MRHNSLVLLVITLPLAACSTHAPAPVVVQAVQSPAQPPLAARVGSETPAVTEQAPPPAVARPVPVQPPRQLADGSRVPAVQGLLATAERERRAGRLDAASAALERAQRLAPQSALIYQRLAEVRLQQKRWPEAEQFARKGLGFASGAAAQSACWRLIAEARRQQGHHDAAQAADGRAAELEAAATEPL